MTIREQSEPAKIIVLLNNYDMREAKRLIDRGEMPGQHCGGVEAFRKGGCATSQERQSFQ